MAKYEVTVQFSGYARMERTYPVEAESPEHAENIYYSGEIVSEDFVRNDMHNDGVATEPTLIKE